MKTITKNMQVLLAGLYAWIISTFFGAILLDIVYSRIATSALQTSETARMFSEVADFLLFIGTLAILSALGAIVSSWRVGPARNLFIASILVTLATEFLMPILFFPLIRKIQVNVGFNVGSWIRLTAGALSSLLAFAGLWMLYHPTSRLVVADHHLIPGKK